MFRSAVRHLHVAISELGMAHRKDNSAMIGGIVAGGVALVIIIGIFAFSGETIPQPADAPVVQTKVEPPQPQPPKRASGSRSSAPTEPTEIEDDGTTLWVSPTSGPPLDLSYLPGGAQAFLAIQPAAILRHAEGPRSIRALGPAVASERQRVEEVIGVNLLEVERLLVAFYPVDGAAPQPAFLVTLPQDVSLQKMLATWKNPKPTAKSRNHFQDAEWAYFLPDDNKRVFLVCSPELMMDKPEGNGPPNLRREMEKLLRDTDNSRDFTLLFAPNALFADEESLLRGDMTKLRSSLGDFFGDDIRAASLSFHLNDDLFVELRVISTADVSPQVLATNYRRQLTGLPDAVEAYLAMLGHDEYASQILTRMPRMMAALVNFTRIGEEHGQAVLRCYLPAVAAHNLILGTELALATEPASGTGSNSPAAKTSATLADALNKPISLSFPRNTLEKCMDMLAEEIGRTIRIEGKDLQLEGITKNQSFELDERNKPADEILRKVMMKANPDGKLVYVIRPIESGGEDVIFVTTRAAAAKRGDKLPPGFEKPPAVK